MTEVAKCAVEQRIGVLTIDSPPVNALGIVVRRELEAGLRRLAEDDEVGAVVLICGGRTFFAGADIAEFDKPPISPTLYDILDRLEKFEKPLVAAIHGTALGGGFEVALACHYRAAVPSAQMGLPEVKLGLLPGGGGTQRLPRIVGVEAALDLITTGRAIDACEGHKVGIIDAIAVEGRLREDAVAFARSVIGQPLKRIADRDEKLVLARGNPEIFARFKELYARSFRGFKAPEKIIQAVEAAVDLPFDQGLSLERELFAQLRSTTESKAQRRAFFAEREAAKIPDVPSDTQTLPIRRVGVIGAGTMGGGIAMNFLNAGMPVTLVEMNQEALQRGLSVIRRNYENSARKGRMTDAQVEQRMALITPVIGLDALSETDLVIEAVFEEMSIKKDIFASLDGIAKQSAILASNTSFLDLDEIAAVTRRPGRVIGLHFFSPANVMRLLEIVRGKETSKEVVATAMQLAKEIGKVPVLSRVCHGFIANRIMAQRGKQAIALVLEGNAPADVDRVMYDYGFAMGQFQMMDLVGLDVLGRNQSERTLYGDFVKRGRLGQKMNGGFYDYDESRNAAPSPVAAEIIADFARFKGVERTRTRSSEEILGRLLFPVVNEGSRLLEEGIVLRASDIDVAAILGYNWPVYTGGPMFWADTVGIPQIVGKLKEYQQRYGDDFAPSPLLESMVRDGRTFGG